MNDLIKIKSMGEKQVISARELYDFLELDSKNWSRWYRHNIEENDFFRENTDYEGFFIVKNGNETKDFWVTIEMAKHLAMSQKTKKSFKIRDYFIKIEQAWNTPEMIMKRALEIANQRAEEAKQKLLENEYKIDFYDTVVGSKTTADMKTVANVLNFKGVGRNKLFDILRKESILQNDNRPYQKYIDSGWFKMIESKWNNPNTGDVEINFKTVVYQKGIDKISNILKNLGFEKVS